MLQIRKLSPAGQKQILPLLGKCFPDYWEQLAMQESQMPFDEISFAAYCGDTLCGHCGIMIYETADHDGIYHKMGGIASVAVDPEFRNRGIAANLCRCAVSWAEKEPDIISLPLYTGLFRVYESISWRLYPTREARFALPGQNTAALSWSSGSKLTVQDKKKIISIYENSPVYPGKVRRNHGTEFHSWQRIFSDPALTFAVTDTGYAVKYENVLAETGFIPGLSAGEKNLFFAAALSARGCDILLPDHVIADIDMKCSAAKCDPMHGERVMVLDLKDSEFHRENPDLFFSLVDKF